MRISCLQDYLVKGLGVVGKSVGGGSSLPVLANILLETTSGGLSLTANNLETAATCTVAAKIEDEGAITVPARLFTELVSALPAERVDLSLNETTRTLNIRCVHFEANVKGIDAGDFPAMPIPAPGATVIELDPVALRQAIGQVVIAAATEISRPVLAGVHVVIAGGSLTMEASDGFRLARKTLALPTPFDGKVEAVIPARALAELSRLLGGKTEPVQVSVDRTQALFRLGDIRLSCQLIEGNFPKLDQIIPTTRLTSTVVAAADLLKACRVGLLFARDAANIVRLSITPDDDKMVITATSAETGDNTSAIEVGADGAPIEIAFNARYLADAVSAITGDVLLETTEPARPGLVKSVDDDGYLYVIMPMHVAG